MNKYYIGMATSQHDPAIAIVDSKGKVLFAESIERSSKNKRAWNSVPDQIGIVDSLIKDYLSTADEVSICASWSARSLKYSSLVMLLTYLKKKWLKNNTFEFNDNLSLRLAMYKAPTNLRDMFLNFEFRLKQLTERTRLNRVGIEHHLCHAYTGIATSKFSSALCVVMDGMGEGSSTAIFEYKNNQLKRLSKSSFLNLASLGLFYAHICTCCGFDPIKGEEWKVMGLAAYGKKDEEIYRKLRNIITVSKLNLRKSKNYNQIMNELTCEQSFKNADLAFTGQVIFEEILFEYLSKVYDYYPHDNLVLCGGCSLNSAANGKITSKTPFTELHIPMCPGDDGNAIGAAVAQWKHDNPSLDIPRVHSPYLGHEISRGRVESLKEFSGLTHKSFSTDEKLCREVAKLLAEKNIIGWVQGRAEFGPRSLGNRSILADPRDTEVKDKLNATVKFREEFRPFAPSILIDYVGEYFEKNEYSPYMERTLKFKKFDSPGVVHVNRTGRLQTVTEELNPKFYNLISEFHKLSKVPILLNTSFNVMGRPIIHDLEDAIGVFMLSGIDVLVVDNTIFYKN